MHIKNKRGQSTVEYILLATAVVGVMVVFATNKNSGLQAQLNSTLNSASNEMVAIAGNIAVSHTQGQAGDGSAGYQVPVKPGE